MTNPYRDAMKDLMEQYGKAWERARKEEIELGEVSEETERLILMIETEIELLQVAV